MARSRRRTPLVPFVQAESEKADKQAANRRARRIARYRLATRVSEACPDALADADAALPDLREVSDRRAMCKRGRRWRDRDSDTARRYLRK
jgi:hypothetical protein